MMVLDSKKVRKLIRDKGLTQKEVADEIGINPSTISDWIKGNAIPSNLNLQSLAQLLEINPDELITEQTNDASINNYYNFFLPNATVNIGSSGSNLLGLGQDDENLDNKNVSLELDSKVLEEISKQAQGDMKGFIEEIIRNHLKM